MTQVMCAVVWVELARLLYVFFIFGDGSFFVPFSVESDAEVFCREGSRRTFMSTSSYVILPVLSVSILSKTASIAAFGTVSKPRSRTAFPNSCEWWEAGGGRCPFEAGPLQPWHRCTCSSNRSYIAHRGAFAALRHWGALVPHADSAVNCSAKPSAWATPRRRAAH